MTRVLSSPRFLLISAVLTALSGIPAGAQPPSVVMVTIDTLRADRVGSEDSITPALDALARDGVSFRRAIAQVPITLPSHISIMTGTYPMYHGIRDFGGFKLKDERETLAEILRSQGYKTAAFVSSFALDSQWGLDQGFEVYDDSLDFSEYRGVGFNAVERRGDQTIDEVLGWLRDAPQEPFFLWVHLFDPHDPYDPPEPYSSRYRSRPYDGEVAFADTQVGRLLEFLKKQGLYESSLITVLGDHGEGLGEHGEETHGFFIYNTTLHIPWIIKLPGNEFAGASIDPVVRSVDVAPTILQVLRLRHRGEIQGRGLLGLLRGSRASLEESAYSESYYPRYHFGWSSLSSYQNQRYKYIRAPRPEIYDLQEDPGETRNLYAEQTALANQYDSLLESLSQKFAGAVAPPEDPGTVDPETRQRLQSLGYIAISSGGAGPDDDLQRADPKDKIELFGNIRRATMESEQGKFGSSVERLTAVITRDPEIYTARYLQGFNFFQTKQYLRAIEEFKAALKLFPDSPDSIYSLARSYTELGIDDAARLGFERLLEVRPGSSRAHIGLGALALKERETEEAKEHFLAALASEDSPKARIGLGRCLVAQKRLDEAVLQFRAVVSKHPDHAEAHFLLGYTYQQAGKLDEARQHFERARQLAKAPPPQ